MRRAMQLEGASRDAPDEARDPARARRLSAIADAIGRELLGDGEARLTAEQSRLARAEQDRLVARAEALLALEGRTVQDTRRAADWLAFAREFGELAAVITGRLARSRAQHAPQGDDNAGRG